MPNVFKHPVFQKASASVKIPDTPGFVRQREEPLEMQGEAEPVLHEERFEPAVLTQQELTERYRDELEDIRREAAARAYADALNSKRGELQACMDKADSLLQDIQRKQQEFMVRYASELKFLAVDIAERFTLAKISQDDNILKDLVVQTTGRIRNADWLDVQVSEELTGLISRLKEEFAKPEYRGRVNVSPKPGPKDLVRVETQLGAVDATISSQADSLRVIFQAEE